MTRTTTGHAHRALVLLLALALSVRATGASIGFVPDDPIAVVREPGDASQVEPRQISHIRELWESTRRVGDPTSRQALDVNTIDEVPDSSWFENRIGVRPMSIAEIAAGPNRGGPAPGPWTVTHAKTEGVSPGLQMKDAAGQLYFVKFDLPASPERASGAEVISTKLLYAAGYHVPENYITVVAREDLRLAPGASTRDGSRKRVMTENDLDALLQKVARRPDGRYRMLTSKALPGRPLGPFSYYGVRSDDPNDTVPHEHRRALRGLRVFAAWINLADVKSGNSLDTLVPDDGRMLVRHHLVDFNSTLGDAGVFPDDPRSGYEYFLDRKQILLSLATLGLHVRPWLTIHYPAIRSVGLFEGDRFDPAGWKPTLPNRAMLNARPDDTFWAARRVMAFSDEAIRTVVDTAEYSDPRAADVIVDALIKRRDKIGRAWLASINPLVDFAVDDTSMLTFDNVAVTTGLSTPPAAYRVQWFRFENARGSIASVGPVVTAERPRVPLPACLDSDSEFIGADVVAVHADHPAWQQPVRVFFRRHQNSWTLVGLERLLHLTT